MPLIQCGANVQNKKLHLHRAPGSLGKWQFSLHYLFEGLYYLICEVTVPVTIFIQSMDKQLCFCLLLYFHLFFVVIVFKLNTVIICVKRAFAM